MSACQVLGKNIEQCQKQAIAQAFGKAAQCYDQHAAFQRDVGLKLLAKLPADLQGKQILDLGCGTGYISALLSERGAIVTCVDLSAQMLAQAQLRCGDKVCQYRVGDAEALPFANDSFDYVFSSLALQWCHHLEVPLLEMKRVTRTKGQLFFSTLLEGSLLELKESWKKVDNSYHVNDFVTLNRVKVALAQTNCKSHRLDLPVIKVWYDTAFELMRDLKGIGANHVNGRSQGLTSRNKLRRVESEYQRFQNYQGLLPATYQVCLGVIQL
ncbi:malonyl-[acyl-carrier protein] O-methyltransferase BioC [Vibrio sp. 10N.286.49.B3]|uniref:malonyl-ACP O-methyltransferase BioC n=1 Tax=Vibrio sp. 10N.286.49.B3 TaxID=1880855 RepID=UPI000C81AC62|nr:malonyl-ACP O-methyltransferase BioC [Vibrio sp. 10N.286.49.B3]PMH46768.1 malonyl-[acyl-carrier protein] O-methyltransferase BioC [Vibrio sp. 10N.286.49.B3]